MSEAAVHIEELTEEFREAQTAYLAARSQLYDGIRDVIREGLTKSETSRISGLSRVTIDRVLTKQADR